MQNEKVYVIRRKIHSTKPNEVPRTTYVPETFKMEKADPIIPSSPVFEELSKPKRAPEPQKEEIEIPRYQNPPPSFEPVDIRATKTMLQRDVYIDEQKQKKETEEAEKRPEQFFEWQAKMKAKDEEERMQIIKQRHEDLDHCRKRAIKAKNDRIAHNQETGKLLREQVQQELENREEDIDRERIAEIRERAMNDPKFSQERVRAGKQELTRAMRAQIRKDIREAQKERERDVQEKKEKVQAIKSSTAEAKYVYKEPVEITKTRFLAALTDEEAQDLINRHKEEELNRVTEAIEATREVKQKEMDKMIGIMEKLTESREAREAEHVKARQEKKEEAMKKEREEQKKEDEAMLKLDKKMEKKRKQRIKEAEEMEEHSRQIAARNRYLAVNKKALEQKTFQSQQDAQLRGAKERQNSRLKDPISHKASRHKKTQEMTQLKELLGL